MPKVRASSATIGTQRGPTCLSRRMMLNICTNAMVVLISRSPVDFSRRSKVASGGTSSAWLALRRRCGRCPPSARRSRMYSISGDFSSGR